MIQLKAARKIKTGNAVLRQLPSVDQVLRDETVVRIMKEYPRQVVLDAARQGLERERKRILSEKKEPTPFHMPSFIERLREDLIIESRPNLKRVVNATGVVLHTNLGRDPLAEEAIKEVVEAARGYSNLEYDLEKGERGERYSHIEEILRRVSGSEAALAVNNNAAAVLLVLNTLGEGREVIVSRGELVEIGGSFRIPDVMRKSGARLQEVGTTNRTHLKDYENAITSETALILKVHRSNFEISGFTAEVEMKYMVDLGRRYGIPVFNDLGSGSMVDLSRHGLKKEPTVREAVEAGCDIVTFSGDKLLGGPQAGLIVGKKDVIDRLKKNPLTRALRIDKMTVAALESTLRLYRDEYKAFSSIPVLKMLSIPLNDLEKKAGDLGKVLKKVAGDSFDISVTDGVSTVGGGALPLQEMPTRLLSVVPKIYSVNELERRMRGNHVPIIARIEKDLLIMDVRTMLSDDAEIIRRFFEKETGLKGGG